MIRKRKRPERRRRLSWPVEETNPNLSVISAYSPSLTPETLGRLQRYMKGRQIEIGNGGRLTDDEREGDIEFYLYGDPKEPAVQDTAITLARLGFGKEPGRDAYLCRVDNSYTGGFMKKVPLGNVWSDWPELDDEYDVVALYAATNTCVGSYVETYFCLSGEEELLTLKELSIDAAVQADRIVVTIFGQNDDVQLKQEVRRISADAEENGVDCEIQVFLVDPVLETHVKTALRPSDLYPRSFGESGKPDLVVPADAYWPALGGCFDEDVDDDDEFDAVIIDDEAEQVPPDESIDDSEANRQSSPSEEMLNADVSGSRRQAQRLKDSLNKQDVISNPIPLYHTRTLPVFPVDALPSVMATHVRAVAASTQTPPDLAAWAHLVSISTAVQRKIELLVQGDHIESLSIYAMVALPSGCRKDAATKLSMRPLLAFERGLKEKRKEHTKAIDVESKNLGMKLDALRSTFAENQSDHETLREIEALERQIENLLEAPSPPHRMLAADATPEALNSALFLNDGRLGIFETEASGLDTLTGRRYGGGNSVDNDKTLLKAYSGSDTDIMRMKREERIERVALSMFIATQPAILAKLLDGHRREVGLVARCLPCLPENPMGTRTSTSTPIPSEVAARFDEVMTSLLSKALALSNCQAAQLTLTPEALELFKNFFDEIEPDRCPESGAFMHMPEWAGKLEGNVARLAALMHLCEHAQEPEPWCIPVSAVHMANAITIGRYAIEHADHFHRAFEPCVRDADFVWEKMTNSCLMDIEDGVEASLTQTQVHELCRGHFRNMAALVEVLNTLCKHGYLIRRAGTRPPGSSSRGRKPAPVYVINPKALQTDFWDWCPPE